MTDAAAIAREDQLERALHHMPDILHGTAEIRCGTCRFHSLDDAAGMGFCRRYRGSLPMYVRSWELCWHHQGKPVRAALERMEAGDA